MLVLQTMEAHIIAYIKQPSSKQSEYIPYYTNIVLIIKYITKLYFFFKIQSIMPLITRSK